MRAWRRSRSPSADAPPARRGIRHVRSSRSAYRILCEKDTHWLLGSHFIGAAALALEAARIGMLGAAHAQSGLIDPSDTPGPGGAHHDTSDHHVFDALKQVDAGFLTVAYSMLMPALAVAK